MFFVAFGIESTYLGQWRLKKKKGRVTVSVKISIKLPWRVNLSESRNNRFLYTPSKLNMHVTRAIDEFGVITRYLWFSTCYRVTVKNIRSVSFHNRRKSNKLSVVISLGTKSIVPFIFRPISRHRTGNKNKYVVLEKFSEALPTLRNTTNFFNYVYRLFKIFQSLLSYRLYLSFLYFFSSYRR